MKANLSLLHLEDRQPPDTLSHTSTTPASHAFLNMRLSVFSHPGAWILADRIAEETSARVAGEREDTIYGVNEAKNGGESWRRNS